MTAIPPGYVRIVASDPPVTLQPRLAGDRPNVEAGYGGWVEVARPHRRPLSIWTGSPGMRMTLAVLFNQFLAGASIERNLRSLERLATPTASDGQPPRLKLTAQGGGVPHQDLAWVIDSLTWGDALVNQAGDRTRQQVTLSLLEFIADVRVAESSSSANRRKASASAKTKPGASSKRIVAPKGRPKVAGATRSTDPNFGAGADLLTIAARELGDADRWVEIAQLNGIRDPRAIRPGQVIRLP